MFIDTKALRGNDFKSILNGTTVINQKGNYILKSNLPIGVQNMTFKSIDQILRIELLMVCVVLLTIKFISVFVIVLVF